MRFQEKDVGDGLPDVPDCTAISYIARVVEDADPYQSLRKKPASRVLGSRF